jgi:hypothetical protein
VTVRLSDISGTEIPPPEEVQKGRVFQFRNLVRHTFLVHQQWERNSGLFSEITCIVHITKSHRCDTTASPTNFWLIITQLRDVLPTKDSSVVA